MSRDLEEIGALKVRVPGGETVYALPELPVRQVAPEDHLRRVLGEWVVEVAHSANLVVLRTPPGSAHVVGSALDRSGFEGVIGTVAGDDTVLVVAAEVPGGRGGRAHRRLAGTGGCRPRAGPAGRPGRRTGVDETDARTEQGDGKAGGARLQRGPRHVGGRALAAGGARGSRWWRWPSTSARAATSTSCAERALDAGAVESVVVDARAEMAERLRGPAIAANARYEGKYPLVSALSRPVIVRHLVAEARRHGADAVAHGCTGKGNDQVRFEVGTRTLAPDLEIFAPARSWGMTREDCVAYAARHGIPMEATKEKVYSIDQNLWGRAIECGVLEDPWVAPPDDVYSFTRPTQTEPPRARRRLRGGRAGGVDGRALPLAELVAEVGSVVGSYGWGRIDMVENRRVGIKSREIYECPAALALVLAHADLEDLTLERDVAHEKARLEGRWAELVYDGLWFSPLKEALDAFFASTQRHVTGEVRLSLAPGACTCRGGAARCRSTTTASPPTTPPTPSTTPMPRASCACGVSAWPRGRQPGDQGSPS